jgi:HrpA-like RNA helicase
LAAASVAQFLAKKLNVIFGTTVAYKVRFDDTTDPRTEIKFMTDGVLLRELHDDPLLSRYSVIMVDEAHERSANMDFLLGLLKQVLHKRTDFKLIVASATINAEKFSEYFDNAPVIRVEGRQHAVKTIWSDHDCSSPKEMIDEGVARVNDIHYKCQEGHILVFLPSVELIDTFVERIKKGGCDTLIALPAHGMLTNEELEKIFQEYPGKRKVIAATNIAEKSAA